MPELTYHRDGKHSYFRDLALAESGAGGAVGERLERHAREIAVELPKLERRGREAAALAGVQLRVNPNTDSPGSTFAPPLWLLDKFATAPRVGGVLSTMMPRFTLPPGVHAVFLPRLITGTQATAVSDLHPPGGLDLPGPGVGVTSVMDTDASSVVVPIVGQGDVALQLLEQSPAGAHLDWVMWTDLMSSYTQTLEQMLIAGGGTVVNLGGGKSFTGLLHVPGGNVITYTDATPSGGRIVSFFGLMAAAIGNTRQRPPQLWLARSSRWAWLASAEDAQGQPFSFPSHMPPPQPGPEIFDDGVPTPVGAVAGFPLFCDDAIPTTLNGDHDFPAGPGNQDAIIGCRPSDMLLLEAPPRMSVMLEPLSGTLQARLQLRSYAAAILGRYPSGIASLRGTGMTIQAGF